ncbi:uncharacterized protein G2W53_041434 [Senna tora]|uniref:Uncharacterized protein n=1 Tax=Senna tora TaxID=362788 RepID=A0A834VXZ0_9FABA|nr:uncharacterized protein G2W53_041434 [Senna tora]
MIAVLSHSTLERERGVRTTHPLLKALAAYYSIQRKREMRSKRQVDRR